MATTNDPRDRPMAEPGKQQAGAEVGGMSQSADAGLSDSAERSQERTSDPPGASGARPSAPAARPAGATARGGLPPAQPGDDDEEPWRHPPVAPRDEDPLKSLGRAISEPVTGAVDDDPPSRKPERSLSGCVIRRRDEPSPRLALAGAFARRRRGSGRLPADLGSALAPGVFAALPPCATRGSSSATR